MQSPRSFFDPALIEHHGAAFIREDMVDAALARLIPGSRITKGRFTCPARAERRDLVWNHMDQNHRPYIHRTYGDAMRVFIGEPAAFSLTRFGRWPAVIPVFDGYFRENGFYQVICLFGLVVIVNVIQCSETPQGTQMEVDWAIGSHRWLSFAHRFLHRQLIKLNEVQNVEDEVMRERRVELRARGYRFSTDDPNFVSANAKGNNVQFPAFGASRSISLAGVGEGETTRIDLEDRGFLVRRSGTTVEVWPGVCPHEGATLEPGNVSGAIAKCPWHGLEFPARRLNSNGSTVALCGVQVSLRGDTLDIAPLPGIAP